MGQNREEVLLRIGEARIIAVVRENDPDVVPPLVRTLVESGIGAIEITLTTPDGMELLRDAVTSFAEGEDHPLIGAGSLRTIDELERVIEIGGEFAASPVTDRKVIERAAEKNFLMMPGALTPNEVVRATEWGALLVKLFPMPPNGLSYIKGVLAPLPDALLAPSGGISASNGKNLLNAGAFTLNVGSWLTPPGETIEERCDLAAERAGELLAAIREG